MKVETDQTAKIVEDQDGKILFKCSSFYQYKGLMEKLLSPSQFERHISLSYDGIYNVSAKRFKMAEEYMKDNPFNIRTSF